LYGLAAALTQRDELGRTVHFAFASKSLSKHALNWSVNRKETAAIVFGLEMFRELLWGYPDIEVRSNHRTLTYMATSTHLCRALREYMDIISQYSTIKITHLKGLKNAFPDALNRVFPPIEDDQTLEGHEDKKIRKLERRILQRRLKSDQINKKLKFNDKISNDTFIHKQKKFSKDKNLMFLPSK
jgi:hypothetical protein